MLCFAICLYKGIHLCTCVNADVPINHPLQTFRVTIYQTTLSGEGWDDDMSSGQYGRYHNSEGPYLTNQDPVIEEVYTYMYMYMYIYTHSTNIHACITQLYVLFLIFAHIKCYNYVLDATCSSFPVIPVIYLAPNQNDMLWEMR